ncbi:DUF4428 domain-containing protein [Mediterraneibacter faecis]|uniref:DUF4428 domain-containing protein n=2 Tax=Mediterraneibacter TaxID=2316020 RepID=UPI001D019773|nr:DUF4428 domain-containing protein [Mediterraneibacter faecis]MCB5370612.1 DUF4428 domain-containing protein [Mediterraneibacter faecis]MCB6848923.1 DUF4428 domain-containing protein [bacterium TM473]
MGLFDKKNCDICGEKIGLLGNRKLDDGNLCKNCARKLSPWFEERRHSTVEDIKRQLAYREQNKQLVQSFVVTRQFATNTYNVFIDDTKGNFTVAHNLDTTENPDIVPLSSIVMCKMEVQQDRREETYTKDGKTVSYQPPVYRYEYDYTMRIKVRTEWFDDMDFRLCNSRLDEKDRMEIMEIEQVANQIVAALTGNPVMNSGMSGMSGMAGGAMGNMGAAAMGAMGMNNGMPGMNGGAQYGNMGMNNGMPNMNGGAQYGNMGMNNGMPNMNGGAQYGNMGMNNGMQNMNGTAQYGNMGMNNGMQNMNGTAQYGNMGMNNGMQNMNGTAQYGNMGMNNGMQNMNGNVQNGNMGMNQNMNANAQPQTGGTWICQCGAENTGAFCEFCGTPKP